MRSCRKCDVHEVDDLVQLIAVGIRQRGQHIADEKAVIRVLHSLCDAYQVIEKFVSQMLFFFKHVVHIPKNRESGG